MTHEEDKENNKEIELYRNKSLCELNVSELIRHYETVSKIDLPPPRSN